MSSLWTPGGEHPVGSGPSGGAGHDEPPALTAEQEEALAEAAEEMAKVRAQLVAAPAEYVVTNHVMGLYELAAIHLNRDQPDLSSARLAIDALVGVLEACKGRLGDTEPTLTEARAQLQMAFVQVSEWVRRNAEGSTA
jgi:hypothetical protein